MTIKIGHIVKKILSSALPDSLYYRQGDKPNILLFSSRRGGSSYLAGLIACEPGMRFIDQPYDFTYYDVRSRRIREAYLPYKFLSQFISLSEEDIIKIQQYMILLLSGGLREMSRPYITPRNRTILKICNAAPLIDWFSENYPVATVYLIRHPIPQSMSVVRTNWDITVEAYLEDPFFAGSYLSEVQLIEGRRILNKGSHLEKAVLNWLLENLYPLKYAKGIDLTLSYEELVLYPTTTINLLVEELDLRNMVEMSRLMRVPSASMQFSDSETNSAIRNDDKEFLLTKWISALDEDMKRKIQRLLDVYSVNEYSVESYLPNATLFRGVCSKS